MPRTVTVANLVSRAQLVADKENDDHISAAAWRLFLHTVYGTDVHSVVAETAQRYWETLASLTTTGAAYVSEPAGIMSLVRCDYVASAQDRRPLHRIMPGEEARLANLTGSEPLYFSLIDDRIYLWPTPATGLTIEVRYIPQPVDLTTALDADLVDCVTPDGEACLIWGMAAMALARAKQDATLALAKAEQHKRKLLEWAAERSIGDAGRQTVVDIDPRHDPRDAGEYWR